MIGVYQIVCIPTGRFYVGSSDDIPKRKRRHLRDLRRGKHHNAFLQRVYNKYGEASLTWKCKLVETREQAIELEQHYLYSHMHNPKCMNIGIHASGGDNLSRNPKRDEIIARMKASLAKKLAGMSDLERALAFGSPGTSNGMHGKKHTSETRKRISEIVKARGGDHLKGIRKSDEGRKNIAEAARKRAADPNYVNGFKGKTHSKEARKRMGEANVGRKPANVRRIRVGKKLYESVRACAEALGVSAGTICYRIGSSNFPDYSYKD